MEMRVRAGIIPLAVFCLVAGFGTAHAATSLIYVANIVGESVSVIDATTDAVVATIPVGGAPDGIAASPDGRFVYVANAGTNDVSFIETDTSQVVGIVPVGQNPIGVAVTPDGQRVYVANFATPGSVSVIDTATQTVTATIPTAPGPEGVVITPDGAKAYVGISAAAGTVIVIDTASNAISGSVPVGANPRGMAISPDGQYVYVANPWSDNVTVIATATDSAVATIPTGSNPIDVAVTPDNLRLYVANISFDTLPGTGSVSVFDVGTNSPVTTIPTGHHPDGIVVTPDGDKVYFGTTGCCGGPNTVSVLDAETNTVTDSVPVDANPVALTVVSMPCPPAPRPGCREAVRSTLAIRNPDGEHQDSLRWTLRKVPATTFEEFGDPTQATTYSLCFYDGANGRAVPAGQSEIAAHPTNWSPLGTKGHRYKDAAGASDGLTKALLKASVGTATKLQLAAEGAAMTVPTMPLPNTLIGQLIRSDAAVCWQATFDGSDIRRNEFASFKAVKR